MVNLNVIVNVTVTVTDPQTEKVRREQFTTYLVSTEKISVRRRYRDFQWLYGRLQTELPGAIVPIIPHKMALSQKTKFDDDFIETRRRHLEHFMDHVVTHPALARAPSMTPFMLDNIGTEFETGKKKVEAANPTSITSVEESTSTAKKMSNMFAKAGTLIRVKSGKAALLQTPEEQRVEHIQEYISSVESHVQPLTKAAEHLTVLTNQLATTVSSMTTPIVDWKSAYQQSTNQSDEICDMMQALCEFSNDYSHLMHHKHREEQVQFDDAMIHLADDIKAFKIALKQRKQWQVAYTTRSQQITAKDEQISKATHNLKPPEVTGKLSFERNELRKLAEQEKAKLQECTTRFLEESDKSQTRLESQLKQAFCRYAKLQISYTNRINEAWGQLLPYVDDEEQVKEPSGESAEPSENEHVLGSGTANLQDEPAPMPTATPPTPPPEPPPTAVAATDEDDRSDEEQ